MCGIVGFVDFLAKSTQAVLEKMTEQLNHRGPDDAGVYFSALQTSQLGLGHRRLSIIDLSMQGHQPYSFKHYKMVYNGEVYNYAELRQELISLGYAFSSNSDTEVVIKAYDAWGMASVHRFNGMFSIAIWDQTEQTLTLIRDRAGVKPLFWYYHDGLFLFASELKAFHSHPSFLKDIDHDAVGLFLEYGYIPQPHSIFKHTQKLQAGHSLKISVKTGSIEIQKYWDIIDCYNQTKLDLSEAEAIHQTEAILRSACDYRMVSDVPVGIFLSGGYDSSAVTAMIQSTRTKQVKTFSIGFEDARYNEAPFAKQVAQLLNTDHTELYCTQDDAIAILPRLPEIWDEPFGDPSAIPTFLVSQLAKKYVKVSLSADGGDEVFGGYNKYTNAQNYQNQLMEAQAQTLFKNYVASLPHDQANRPEIRAEFLKKYWTLIAQTAGQAQVDLMQKMQQFFSKEEISQLMITRPGRLITGFDDKTRLQQHVSGLDKMMAIDFKTYQLDEILVKVDRATMAVGLEGREPMLDYRLVEFVARLDSKFKIHGPDKKYLLKKITHKYIPAQIMDRPKMGFNMPVADWLKGPLLQTLMYYLDEARVQQAGLLSPTRVTYLKNQFLQGQHMSVNKIWNLLMLQMWHERWMV